MKIIKKLQVVVETTEYIKQAETCKDKESRDAFIIHIAQISIGRRAYLRYGWRKKDPLNR